MAAQRSATVLEVRDFGPDTRLLTLSMPAGESLGFQGGQYVIVDAGVKLPNGKQAKRAFSMLSADAEQGAFQLAAKRLDGPGSGFLHRAKAGDSIPFSGPWGKFFPEGAGKSLVFVTDTAITAGLGLVRGKGFPEGAHLAWLLAGQDYFLPPDWVREQLPAGCTFEVLPIPTTNHPDRLIHAQSAFRTLQERLKPERVYLAGDGKVVLPIRDALPPESVKVEVYFNDPARKSA